VAVIRHHQEALIVRDCASMDLAKYVKLNVFIAMAQLCERLHGGRGTFLYFH
jgi:hypothetical protein